MPFIGKQACPECKQEHTLCYPGNDPHKTPYANVRGISVFYYTYVCPGCGTAVVVGSDGGHDWVDQCPSTAVTLVLRRRSS